MFLPWYTTTMLAIESHGVIALRLLKMSGGGSAALQEAQLMVSEKVDAAIEAGLSLMVGGSTAGVIDRYREHVAANTRRLAHA